MPTKVNMLGTEIELDSIVDAQVNLYLLLLMIAMVLAGIYISKQEK